ncbi:hypothetical protein Csa_013232 [Cucumis sativus]|uniref:Uncharacterized protein n=1 Tax=Cucumis sativus TaxID=3659 RepID=A0A0A0LXK5_CUCSA|nr:hypothetical protein Csa_013232 [Cucumis sativus]
MKLVPLHPRALIGCKGIGSLLGRPIRDCEESALHILWGCKFARRVWRLSHSALGLSCGKFKTIQESMAIVSSSLDLAPKKELRVSTLGSSLRMA